MRLSFFKISLLIFGCALFLIALFPKPVLLQFCVWKIRHEVKKELNGEFSFESAKWEEGSLIFTNCKLYSPSLCDLMVEEVKASPFEKKIVVTHPVLTLYKKKDFSLSFLASILDQPEWMTTIVDAHFLLYDETGAGPVFQQLTCSVTPEKVVVGCGDEPVELSISGTQEKTVLKIATPAQKLETFYPLCAYFCSKYLAKPYGSWECSQGTVQGGCTLVFENKSLCRMEGQIACKELLASNEKLKLMGRLDELATQFDFNFTNSEESNCDFKMKDCALSLMGNHPEFWRGLWDFHLFDAEIGVKKGQVTFSQIWANLLGMEGEIALKYHPEDPLLRLKFEGPSKKITQMLPVSFQKAFEKAFPNDYFALQTTIRKNPVGVDLEGQLTIDDMIGQINHLDFGCHFGHSEEDHRHPLLGSIYQQFALSNKRVGWFRGNNFKLEKFLSPFLFRYSSMSIGGNVDFEGSFDEHFMAVYYKGKNFSMEGSTFKATCDQVLEGISNDIVACHYFDLNTLDHVGILPVTKARYVQKNLGFSFDDASFSLFFENRKIDIRDIKAKSYDIALEGDMKLDLARDAPLDLKIVSKRIVGDLPSVRTFLGHIFPSIFWQFPVLGKVESGKEDLMLHFQFDPKSHLVEGHVRGKVNAEFVNDLAHIHDYGFSFEYDRERNCLDIDHGLGTLAFKEKDYRLHIPKISIYDFPSPQVKGALHLARDGKEVFHLDANYTKDALTVEGNLINIYGRHEKGRLAIDKFIVGALEGAAEIGWEGPKVQLSFQDLKSKDQVPLSFAASFDKKVSSEDAWTIKGLELALGTTGHYVVDNCKLDIQRQNLQLQDFDFTVSKERIAVAKSWLEALWPGKIPEKVFALIEGLKKEEPLCGKLSVELGPGHTQVKLALKDGYYNILGKDHLLRSVECTYEPNMLKLSGDVFYRNRYFSCLARCPRNAMEGVLELRADSQASDAISAHWKRSGEHFLIQMINGSMPGVDVFLTEKSVQDGEKLAGKIAVDVEKVLPLLSASMQAGIRKMGLAGRYSMEGDFDLTAPSFSGRVRGDNFEVGGFEFDHLSSVVTLSKEGCELKHLVVEDIGGRAEIESANLIREGEKWRFSAPQVKVENVRLARLKHDLFRKSGKKGFVKTFFISSFRVDHVSGIWGDPTSYRGKGSVCFSQIQPKNFFTSLLSLPKAITARIGLDLNLFVPSRGEVKYDIHDGKIHLLQFKGMYSEGKRSRFYLAEGMPAWVDFEGNLNLKVKMKQYNLLMKVAELFVVTVYGDIFKPQFSLSSGPENETST